MAVASFQVGIETEMILRLRDPHCNGRPDIEQFARGLSRHYNKGVQQTEYPKMQDRSAIGSSLSRAQMLLPLVVRAERGLPL